MEEKSTFATSLQEAGYRTGMMGKYLNGYTPMGMVDGAPRFVPPGWSAWAVAGNGYAGFNYNLLVKHPGDQPPELVHYGNRPRDYMTDVLSLRGRRFIAGAVKAAQAVHARARDVPPARAVHARAAAREPVPERARAARAAVQRAAAAEPAVVAADRAADAAADRADRLATSASARSRCRRSTR